MTRCKKENLLCLALSAKLMAAKKPALWLQTTAQLIRGILENEEESQTIYTVIVRSDSTAERNVSHLFR